VEAAWRCAGRLRAIPYHIFLTVVGGVKLIGGGTAPLRDPFSGVASVVQNGEAVASSESNSSTAGGFDDRGARQRAADWQLPQRSHRRRSGNDLIRGGGGNDGLYGGPGNDRIVDHRGAATVFPGSGTNRVDVADGRGDDRVLRAPFDEPHRCRSGRSDRAQLPGKRSTIRYVRVRQHRSVR